jgi:cysteine desulfurase
VARSASGALVLSNECRPVALLHGGGQERDVRSGTLDAASSAGFAVAAGIAAAEQPARAAALAVLRDALLAGLRDAVPDLVVNGALGADRLPANAHVSFPGCEGDSLLMLFDARGVECSTGSACSAGVPRPSHVLLAMGLEESLARGSLRFSLGRSSTDADVRAVLAAVEPVVERARRAGQASVPSAADPAVDVEQAGQAAPAGV